MSTIDNIITLLKAQNKTQKDLCDYLGITKNAFTDWKSGRIKSYTKHLPQIADYFGVTVDYLLGNTAEKAAPSPMSEEDVKVALFGGEGEVTPEMWADVKKYVEFVKSKYNK